MSALDTPGRLRPFAGCLADLNTATERMIAIQMTAYPSDWSAAEKRELAEQHLFGRAEGAMA